MGVLTRGLSLPELLVAMGLFAALLLVVVSLQVSTRGAYQQAQIRDQDFRQGMLAAEHVRRLLEGSKVVSATPGRLDLQIPRRPLTLDPQGKPVLEDVTIILAQGRLQEQRGTELRLLADLGEGGEFRAEWADPATPVRLRVALKAARQSDASGYVCEFEIFMPNQGR